MVEMFRQEELASLKRELDDLTELFIQIEQGKREDEYSASNKLKKKREQEGEGVRE